MSAYIDSGILVKGYVLESNSPEAASIIQATGLPVLYSHLHEIELPNAIRLKRFRGEITREEEVTATRMILADIEVGRLARPSYDLQAVFRRAGELSALHSNTVGSRSLDLLHVATALECGCSVMASFDQRQRRIAVLAGLETIP